MLYHQLNVYKIQVMLIFDFIQSEYVEAEYKRKYEATRRTISIFTPACLCRLLHGHYIHMR